VTPSQPAELRAPTPSASVDAVVFDIGGVLVDGDYRYLYRKLIGDEAEIEHFLATVCTQEWHTRHDAGYPMRSGVADLVARHPDKAELIVAFHERFPEVWAGPIDGTVAVAEELRAAGVPLYLLSNWPAEMYPVAQQRFPFLVELFDGAVVSGFEGVVKPDPRIFDVLTTRYRLRRSSTVFIDDNEANVAAATQLGLRAVRFTDPDRLRRHLRDLGLPIS
jgi:2-haloacid dehalogenase